MDNNEDFNIQNSNRELNNRINEENIREINNRNIMNSLMNQQNMNDDNNSGKKSVLVSVVALIVFIVIGIFVFTQFNNGDETNNIMDDNIQEEENNQEQNDNLTISVIKNEESFYFNVILDTNGNVYLGVKSDSDFEDDDVIANLFKNAKIYSYNDKNERLVKLDLQNIKDIQCINYGNGGGKYLTFLNQDDKLYVLLDFDILDKEDLTPLTDEKLNKVIKIYPECDEEGCMVYADVVINDKEEKVSLYDLFEEDN